MATARTRAGDSIVKEVFGGSLYEQGRGYYVTLEVLAIAWGTHFLGYGVLPRSSEMDPLRYARRSHDYARRIMGGREEELTPGDREHFGDDPVTRATLQALLAGLRVPIPFRRKLPMWGGQHLYPYIGELIHHDAVSRRGSPKLERYAYRGAGLLVHEILRTDPNADRLEAVRSGLTELVDVSQSSLGRLASALSEHDAAPGGYAEWTDELAQETTADARYETKWFNVLRDGVHNILTRDTVRAKKVEQLMHWIPYCIARHQLELARIALKASTRPIPVDVAAESQVRRISRRTFDRDRFMVSEVLRVSAEQAAAKAEDDDRRTAFQALLDGSQTWRKGPATFYAATMATVGALNHVSGRRHYTLALPMLEALVAALLRPNARVEFETFCQEHLYERLGLVVDQQSASASQLTHHIDAADFEPNAHGLAEQLSALGMLTEYSDATRLVHAEVL
jgi:hypothetical protein